MGPAGYLGPPGRDKVRKDWGNGRTALIAWVLATLLVGGGYLAFQLSRGEPVRLNTVVKAAAAAGLYALYVGWRFRGDGSRE